MSRARNKGAVKMSYEIVNYEAQGEALSIGRIECHAGSGGVVLHIAGRAPNAVLFYANVADALQAVRLHHGFPNAYLQDV